MLILIMLHIDMLSVLILIVIMLSVIMLSVILLSVIMLGVIRLKVVAPLLYSVVCWDYSKFPKKKFFFCDVSSTFVKKFCLNENLLIDCRNFFETLKKEKKWSWIFIFQSLVNLFPAEFSIYEAEAFLLHCCCFFTSEC